MNLELIKKEFENKSFLVRSNFIKKYDFKDNYQDYYKQFLIDNILTIKDKIYLADLIDLASDLMFFDDEIYNLIKLLLFQKTHTIIKISVISYLEMRTENLADNNELEQLLVPLLKPKLSKLLRNQLLFTLVEYGTAKNKYFDSLVTNIQSTDDWRSMHRILDGLKNRKLPVDFTKRIVVEINTLHQQLDFGTGVAAHLKQFEYLLN